MQYTHVVYISELAVGSKFRIIGDRIAQIKVNQTKGIKWASCKVMDNGGNFQRPSFHDPAAPPERTGFRWFNGTWIKTYPPKFNIFNRPCPWSIGHLFPQGEY